MTSNLVFCLVPSWYQIWSLSWCLKDIKFEVLVGVLVTSIWSLICYLGDIKLKSKLMSCWYQIWSLVWCLLDIKFENLVRTIDANVAQWCKKLQIWCHQDINQDFKLDITKISKKISNLTSSRHQTRLQTDIIKISDMTSNIIKLISSRHQARLQIYYHKDIKLEFKFDIM